VIGIDHDCHRLADGSADRLAKPDVLTDAKAELEFDRRKACIGTLLRLVPMISSVRAIGQRIS
jgi:hypothetical protein